MSKKERIIIFLLACLNFTHIMDFMIMMPLGNFLMPHFKITPQQFSIVVAAYTFSAGISGFLAAFFVDRFDRKKLLMWAYVGFLIGTLCCGFAPSYILLLAARIVAGIFGGMIGAQVLSIIADLIPYERRASAMGMAMAAFSMASVFGVPFALYLANHFSWHAPFFLVAGIGAMLIPFLLKYIPRMTGHIHSGNGRISPLELLKGIGTDKNQLLALTLSACLMMGHFMIIPFLNPFMEFNMGFSKTETPMVYFVGGALTLVTSPIIGRISDKFGKFRVFAWLVSVAVFPIAFITNMPHIPFYYVLCVTGFWFIVSAGRSIPAQAMISNVVPPERRGSFMSFNSSVQQIFVGLASVIVGAIVTNTPDGKIEHYNVTGYLSIAIILSSLIVAYQLNKSINKPVVNTHNPSDTVIPPVSAEIVTD
jgi:predicted MFS family arabinose efflux permease